MVSKVIISSGRMVGGLSSFAAALSEGFSRLGIESEVLSTAEILKNIEQLRDEKILKIFSTSAVFLAPFAQNVVCVSHGLPRIDCQSAIKVLGILISLKIFAKNKKIISVSNYVSLHLKVLYNINSFRVIKNPIDPIFLEESSDRTKERNKITFVGRIHVSKNLDKMLPIVISFKNKNPNYRIVVAGDGPLYDELKLKYGCEVEFSGELNKHQVRELLSETKIFFSGCETEALGISYIEALSQGCSIVMPLSGGGLEITNDLMSSPVYCFPIDFNDRSVYSAFQKASMSEMAFNETYEYAPENVAQQYLKLSL